MSADQPFPRLTVSTVNFLVWELRDQHGLTNTMQWCLRCLAQKVLIAETGLCTKVREATLDLGRWGLGGSERKTCGSIALPSISSRLHTLHSLRALYRAPTVHSQDCAQWLHCRVNWTLHWKQWIKCQRLVLCASRKEFLPHLPTLTLEPQKTRAPSCGNTIFSLSTPRSQRSKHFLASHTNNFSSLALWSFVYVSKKTAGTAKRSPGLNRYFCFKLFFLYKIEDIFADFRIFW